MTNTHEDHLQDNSTLEASAEQTRSERLAAVNIAEHDYNAQLVSQKMRIMHKDDPKARDFWTPDTVKDLMTRDELAEARAQTEEFIAEHHNQTIATELGVSLNYEADRTGEYEDALSGYSVGFAQERGLARDDARGRITLAHAEKFGETIGQHTEDVRDLAWQEFQDPKTIPEYMDQARGIVERTLATEQAIENQYRAENNLAEIVQYRETLVDQHDARLSRGDVIEGDRYLNRSEGNPMGFFQTKVEPVAAPVEEAKSTPEGIVNDTAFANLQNIESGKAEESNHTVDFDDILAEVDDEFVEGDEEELTFIAVYDEDTGEYSYTSVSLNSPSSESESVESSSDNSYSPDFDSLSSEMDSEGSSYEGDFDIDGDFGISSDDD